MTGSLVLRELKPELLLRSVLWTRGESNGRCSPIKIVDGFKLTTFWHWKRGKLHSTIQ
jgi:hypothetical protein